MDTYMNTHIKNIRKSILDMMYTSRSSHIGSCFSIVEILYTLYFRILRIKGTNFNLTVDDKFILSKAHGSVALYATLSERGFFDKKKLEEYYVDGGSLPGHLDMKSASGIECSGGSLGHGLSIGIGMAIANQKSNVYVLLGDGECNEGSVWEAAMLASHLRLANLTAIIDYNKLQGFGETNEVINQRNLHERWSAFGWNAIEVNGHNVDELERELKRPSDKPKAIIAHTVKGKGVSFMENKLEWHYKSPNKDEYLLARSELEGAS